MGKVSLIVLAALLAVSVAFGDCTRRAVQYQAPQKVKKVTYYQYQYQYQYDHYYSLDPYYQQQALAAQLLKELKAELLKMQALQGPAKAKSGEPKVEVGPRPQVEKESPILAGPYQNEKLLAIVNNSCTKCHGVDSKQSSFVTRDGKSLADVSAGKVWEAFALVNSGEMPKAADQLNDEAVQLFYEWGKKARKR